MYVRLTEHGKDYIRSFIINNSKQLSGNKTMRNVNFTRYFEVFELPDTTNTNNFEWKIRRGKKYNNVAEYANDLIKWYDEYAKEYEIDANVLGAQTYVESLYYIWDFSERSNGSPAALGLSQFLPETVKSIAIDNSRFSESEKDLIRFGLSDDYLATNWRFNTGNEVDELNMPILHQNLIDNPRLMVKMQADYMNYCANLSGGLASSALFGYNRGPRYIRSNYLDSINYFINSKNVDINSRSALEGIEYVFRIFAILGDKDNLTEYTGKPKGKYFGYDGTNVQNDNFNLNMIYPPSEYPYYFDDKFDPYIQ